MLYEMTSRKIAPKGILFNSANTILAQGAALARMAMVDRFEDGDVTKIVKTGDHLIVCPNEGKVIFVT
jgi:predicted aconitase with swiveling domain